MKYSVKTKTGKSATITTRVVGQSFGCEAVLRVSGRIVYETGVLPYGMTGEAYSRCEDRLDQY